MAFIAGLLGSAAGIVAIAVGVLLMSHAVGHVPGRIKPWVMRLVIIIMYSGGAVFAVSSDLANLARDTAVRLGALVGGASTAIFTIVSLFLILGLIVGFIWTPAEAVAFTAVAVPLVISLVPGGAIHAFYAATTAPAQQFAASLNIWLAG